MKPDHEALFYLILCRKAPNDFRRGEANYQPTDVVGDQGNMRQIYLRNKINKP